VAYGQFMSFQTVEFNEVNGKMIKRFYQNDRMEIKIPCEHTKTATNCAMEIQFYCTEVIDYTLGYPVNKIANLAFSLMF
jgi:hypothetical protein